MGTAGAASAVPKECPHNAASAASASPAAVAMPQREPPSLMTGGSTSAPQTQVGIAKAITVARPAISHLPAALM